jgi:hypothetical protein
MSNPPSQSGAEVSIAKEVRMLHYAASSIELQFPGFASSLRELAGKLPAIHAARDQEVRERLLSDEVVESVIDARTDRYAEYGRPSTLDPGPVRLDLEAAFDKALSTAEEDSDA